MEKFIILWVFFVGFMVNVLAFPNIYHEQLLIAFSLGFLSIGGSLFYWRKMSTKLQKIGLIFGMIINAYPLIWFIFFC